MKQVIVDISPAGSVKVEAQGFNGVGCDKATEQIEIVLGGAGAKSKKRKPEFFAAPSTKTGTKLTF
jgi:hypothetical protein